ncbi:MAG: VWA domain-containing protein [Gemmataceae bacterium]
MFFHPNVLWVLLIVPALGLLSAYARWRRRRALDRLGNRFRIERLVELRPGRRRIAQSLAALAAGAVVLGLAGPHWGEEKVETRPPYKELVVVLDVSRSMLAEQPSRLERGLRALEDLSAAYRKRGEVRVGLVLIAAKPKLQLPPSQDYDHFNLLLDRVRRGDMPPELWPRTPDAVSGTRLGAGLTRAAELKRPKSSRSFALLLVSDGDDPLSDDEWLQGVQAARERKVPIHVLAIGDPERSFPVPETIRNGESAVSKMNEKTLQEIARRTGGAYIPALTTTQIPLGRLMGEIDESERVREAIEDETDPELLQPKARHAWFYLAAALCLTLSLSIGEARKP